MPLADKAAGRDGGEPVPVELDTSTVHIRSVGYTRWRRLIEEHPSKDRRLRWDREKFVPAAFLKCVVEADDEDDVTRFLIDARPGEVEELLKAIVDLHEAAPENPTSPRD